MITLELALMTYYMDWSTGTRRDLKMVLHLDREVGITTI